MTTAIKTETKLVFVYGSLKKGLHNHSVLGNSTLKGKGDTLEKFTMVSLGSFPGIHKDIKTSVIVGEVYEVTDDVARDLDMLEGYPSFYDREDTVINLFNGECVTAIMYYLADPKVNKGTPIPSGIWAEEEYASSFFSNRSNKE